MAEKETMMVMGVDLGCHKCQKKIKKILCRLPQVRNQIYDEKANTVTITVRCCSPEEIKQKICCRGGNSVKSIEIKAPEKPKQGKNKEAEEHKEENRGTEKNKGTEKDKGTEKKRDEKQSKENGKSKGAKEKSEPSADSKSEKPKKNPPSDPKLAEPVPGYPPAFHPNPCRCFDPYQQQYGYGWGSCQCRPLLQAQPPCYGRVVYDTWGGGGGGSFQGWYGNRCYQPCQESSSTCTIM